MGFVCVTERPSVPGTNVLEDLRRLAEAGVRIFPEVCLTQPLPKGVWSKFVDTVLLARAEALLPGAGQAARLERVLNGWVPDAVLTIWSERATALASTLTCRKLAYYGNPDHKVAAAGAEFEWRMSERSARDLVLYIRRWFRAWLIRRAHLRVMRGYDGVGDVALNDADFYRAHGVRGAFYIPNMWHQKAGADWETRRDRLEVVRPLRIVGNVGSLRGTGNGLGLHTLATQIVPALRNRLGERAFQVHVFGGGEPHPAISKLLLDPHVVLRGFVDDLDSEILVAPVFLVANNNSRFRVGHTRFLHAWSLGACVIAFRGSAEAMPELEHGVNALLASTPREMAELTAMAAADAGLRRRLGRAGYRTLSEKFSPDTVTKLLIARLAGTVRSSVDGAT